MSIAIVATLTCDTCGQMLVSEPQYTTSRGQTAVWDLKSEARLLGWIQVNRGRYYTPTHYCKTCADKPMKPKPRIRKR
jgi:hypothetical protein